MSDSKERACPFCNGKKIKFKTDDGIHWAECQTCFAEGPIGSKRSDDDAPRWDARPSEDAAQVELAALREELASANADKAAYAQNAIDLRTSRESMRDRKNSIVDLQQRLTAAEQRNAEASAAMQLATKLLDQTLSSLNQRNSLAYEIRHFLAAHRNAKPTESGASE